jgi:hypothetical protein
MSTGGTEILVFEDETIEKQAIAGGDFVDIAFEGVLGYS